MKTEIEYLTDSICETLRSLFEPPQGKSTQAEIAEQLKNISGWLECIAEELKANRLAQPFEVEL